MMARLEPGGHAVPQSGGGWAVPSLARRDGAPAPPTTEGTVTSTRIVEHLGRVLGGRYRLLAPIGTGASAHVFLADDVRLRRRQRAEEAAMKAPVKMLFPLIACILPSTILVVLGPGLVTLFGQVLVQMAADAA